MTNSKSIKLEAQTRSEKNDTAKNNRKSGFIPANLYGKGVKNSNLKIKDLDFKRAFGAAGESHLIDLAIDKGSSVKVIVKDVQKDAIKDNIIHIDFYQVDMKEKITTQIPLKFIGESKAVKEKGGILVKSFDTLEVKCFPGDLVDNIEVDLSGLNDFHDHIRIEDVKLPQGMEVVADANEILATIAEPAKEEIAPAAPAAEAASAAPAAEGEAETKK